MTAALCDLYFCIVWVPVGLWIQAMREIEDSQLSQGRRPLPSRRAVLAGAGVTCAAMLYMFAALAGPSAEGSGMSMSGPGGMSGMAGGPSGGMPTLHAPTLALIFALLLIAFTVHDLDRQAGVDGYFHVVGCRNVPAGSALAVAAAVPVVLLLSPAVVKGCQVAIGVTMAFTLIIMI